jgi:hypothetical protein
VDSSLLDEWERMQRPESAVAPKRASTEAWDVTRDERAFTVLIRNELYRLLRALAGGAFDVAAEILSSGETTERPAAIQAMLAPFYAEHAEIRLDPAARSPKTRSSKGPMSGRSSRW